MTEFIIAGGPFMWPLLACSVLIITIAVERLWFLQIRLVSPNGLTNQIVNLFNKNLINNKQAEEIAELSSLGFLLVSCIKYKDLPREFTILMKIIRLDLPSLLLSEILLY